MGDPGSTVHGGGHEDVSSLLPAALCDHPNHLCDLIPAPIIPGFAGVIRRSPACVSGEEFLTARIPGVIGFDTRLKKSDVVQMNAGHVRVPLQDLFTNRPHMITDFREGGVQGSTREIANLFLVAGSPSCS